MHQNKQCLIVLSVASYENNFGLKDVYINFLWISDTIWVNKSQSYQFTLFEFTQILTGSEVLGQEISYPTQRWKKTRDAWRAISFEKMKSSQSKIIRIISIYRGERLCTVRCMLLHYSPSSQLWTRDRPTSNSTALNITWVTGAFIIIHVEKK